VKANTNVLMFFTGTLTMKIDITFKCWWTNQLLALVLIEMMLILLIPNKKTGERSQEHHVYSMILLFCYVLGSSWQDEGCNSHQQ